MTHENTSEQKQTGLLVGVVDDDSFDLHKSTSYHPERPERLQAARAGLRGAGLRTEAVTAREATTEELARVHGGAYLDQLAALAGRRAQLDADTYLAPDSVVAVRRAAGGSVDLVEGLLAGRFKRGVALLRPPGHHARPNQAMGFCLLNNVAVAAAHALARGVSRIAIVDWDVHHGNGTQEMFFSDPRVLYASLHQWPFYPGTGNAPEIGEGEGRGYTLNIPLSQGAHSGDYAAAFERVLLPVLEGYRPELILVSAGFDAHRDDPLAAMRLDAAAYGWMTAQLLRLAEKTASGRMALFLEGGYDLGALEQSLAASLRVLGELAPGPTDVPPPQPVHEAEIKRTKKALEGNWRVFD
ncbi:MAG TPA: histone deacetylase [Polyangiaceae bacterium]|nr:histone deacetylase [Polyangiaceae bacterium]